MDDLGLKPRQRQAIFLFPRSSRPTLGPITPPTPKVLPGRQSGRSMILTTNRPTTPNLQTNTVMSLISHEPSLRVQVQHYLYLTKAVEKKKRFYLLVCDTMKIEDLGSSETFVKYYPTTWLHIPDDSIVHSPAMTIPSVTTENSVIMLSFA